MTTPIVTGISDDQLEELEKIVICREQSHINQKIMNGTIEGLIARLSAAEKDAARYLWLRDRVGVEHAYGEFMAFLPTGSYKIDEQAKKQTDEAIDAAMEQSK